MTTELTLSSADEHLNWFRHACPYINEYRGKVFVVMLPGTALQHDNLSNIIYDLTLLHSLGVKLAIAFGARPQIESKLEAEGIESVLHEGRRVTTRAVISHIESVVGFLRVQIEAAFSRGAAKTPMQGSRVRVVSGNLIVARPTGVINGVDLHWSGTIRRIDHEALRSVVDAGAIALLPPLGFSPTGEVFNLEFSEVAVQAARSLNAEKLIAYTSGKGFSPDGLKVKRELTLVQCEQQLRELAARGEESHSLTACFQACTSGVPRAQMVSYCDNGAVLSELFTRDGTGTMVHADSYEEVRPATIDDVGGILELITPLEKEGSLVRRSREVLEQEIDRFTLVMREREAVACAALHHFEDGFAELACVATHGEYRGKGYARRVVEAIEERARKEEVKTLFLLTTQAIHWFQELGYEEGGPDMLPPSKREAYNTGRKSRVFLKTFAV